MMQIDNGRYPNNLPINPGAPATIGGTGTTTQLYGGSSTPVRIAIPGSNRAAGTQFDVRAGGSVFPGVASNVKLQLQLVYPSYSNGAAQYPTANITSASMTNNVALYNGTNNFVIGQYVQVANIANTDIQGTVGPLLTANANAFTAANINGVALAEANIANAAQTATAAIAPVPLYNANVSPTLTVNVNAPWCVALRVFGDSTSNVVSVTGSDWTVNANGTALVPNLSTGTAQPAPGVNFQLEPAFYLQVGHAFGTSNANNAGKMQTFVLEGQ